MSHSARFARRSVTTSNPGRTLQAPGSALIGAAIEKPKTMFVRRPAGALEVAALNDVLDDGHGEVDEGADKDQLLRPYRAICVSARACSEQKAVDLYLSSGAL